jgi:hydrogenase maturation protease
VTARQILIVGIGHPDRGDDAVGRIVAARLREHQPPNVMVAETHGEAAALLDLIAGQDDVIIVDAGLSGGEPGLIHRLDAVAAPLPRPMFATSSHAIGLAESIELARTLGTLPHRCIVFAIEGRSFNLGGGLSPPVAGAVEEVVERVLAELPVAV